MGSFRQDWREIYLAQRRRGAEESAMAAALVCVAVVLGIYPADRTVWCVEMVWAVGLWAILLLTRRRTSSATPSARSAPRRFSCAEKRDLHDEEK